MSIYMFLAIFCVAQVQAEEVFELETIEVSAKKRVSDFNFSKPDIVTTSELENEPFGLIAPQLNKVPGVIANQNGGPGGRVSFFIRGTESRHVAFTLDGMKLNDPSNNDRQFDSAFFSSPFLKNVQVHKGPQAVLYGSDSMGGLIEMSTRKGENAKETRFDINGGSFGTIDSSLSHDWKSGDENARGTLTAYRFHSDGISRLNKKRFRATERDASDITQLSSSSNHQWNSKLDTDLLFSFLRGENELDGNSDDNSHDKSTNDQYIAQQKTNYQITGVSAISLRNGFNRHYRFLDQLTFEGAFEGDIFQNEVLYVSQYKKLSLLSGLATEHEQFKQTTDSIDESTDLHSLFLQSSYSFSDLKVHAGARAEEHSRYGMFYTGSGGLGYTLGSQLFSLQYSQGFKAPSLYQLYHPVYGNFDLVPEVNHSWEGSWYLNNEMFETGIVLFQNSLSNLVTWTSANGYINQNKFIAEGVELSGKLKQKYYHFTSSFTHQAFREQETVILRRPYNTLIAGLAAFPSDISEVSIRGRWYSSRKDVDAIGSNVKLSGFEVFDLGFKYIFPKVELGLKILNIFDRSYEELYGYSVMPRSLFFHTGFRF